VVEVYQLPLQKVKLVVEGLDYAVSKYFPLNKGSSVVFVVLGNGDPLFDVVMDRHLVELLVFVKWVLYLVE